MSFDIAASIESMPENTEIIQWGRNYLSSHGYTLNGNQPEHVQNTPWSYVVRFATSDGYVYLKHTPKLIALEATIIQVLHEQFRASVPTVIAHHGGSSPEPAKFPTIY